MQTKAALLSRVGGLSKPSKMPGYAWSIPAIHCHVGSRLRIVKGSVCEKCYALKGRYVFKHVQAAMQRRLDIYNTSTTWVEDMVAAIACTGTDYFRIFDSGDLQSVKMLTDWLSVVEQLPAVMFWMPTREFSYVKKALDMGVKIPYNISIRMSNHMIDDTHISVLTNKCSNINMSSVISDKTLANCLAYKQGNVCGSCRKCWDISVPLIMYPKH